MQHEYTCRSCQQEYPMIISKSGLFYTFGHLKRRFLGIKNSKLVMANFTPYLTYLPFGVS